MKIYGVDLATWTQVVIDVSYGLYDGNISTDRGTYKWSEKRGPRSVSISVSLRVNDSSGPGARRSVRGHRMIAATWAAHRDVLTALFERCPDAKVRSKVANYDGRGDFLDKFPDTYYHNAGSALFHVDLGLL